VSRRNSEFPSLTIAASASLSSASTVGRRSRRVRRNLVARASAGEGRQFHPKPTWAQGTNRQISSTSLAMVPFGPKAELLSGKRSDRPHQLCRNPLKYRPQNPQNSLLEMIGHSYT